MNPQVIAAREPLIPGSARVSRVWRARLAIADFPFVLIFLSLRKGKVCLGETPKPDTRDACATQHYSPETTHKLDGERPEKRLSYIGTTCVAGQRNVPAAVARASTE